MEHFFETLGILIYCQERICKFSSRVSFGMDGIHSFQDLFPTSKLVHSSVIVSGHDCLRPFNDLTVEKIIFLYPILIYVKLSYSILKFYVVMLMFLAL